MLFRSLTSTEKEMLHNVYSHFKNVIVVLNVSNIIDMNFMQDSNHIKAVVYAWQGGMEGGNGTADVLTGKEVFQGKLTDTIAKKITDYPADKNHGGKEKNVYQEDIYVGYRYFETFARDTVLYHSAMDYPTRNSRYPTAVSADTKMPMC